VQTGTPQQSRQEDFLHTLNTMPNPVASDACLRYTLDTPAAVQVELLDMLGNRVTAEKHPTLLQGTHQACFSTAAFAQGAYTIRILAISRTGAISTKTASIQIVR
jgi:hypothetical protein